MYVDTPCMDRVPRAGTELNYSTYGCRPFLKKACCRQHGAQLTVTRFADDTGILVSPASIHAVMFGQVHLHSEAGVSEEHVLGHVMTPARHMSFAAPNERIAHFCASTMS